MHEIDLNNFSIHTDLVFDDILDDDTKKKVFYKKKDFGSGVFVEEVKIPKDLENIIKKRAGRYKMISFVDITDRDNFNVVLNVFKDEFSLLLNEIGFKKNMKVLVVGLGNYKSTPDAVGPRTLKNILVTSHLFSLGEVEDGYCDVSIFEPFVTGETGIDTRDIICALKDKIKPDLIIFVDALATVAIDRVNRSIQLSDSGINPGSGVCNARGVLDSNFLGCEVIVVGIPTVMDSLTIVSDTINYMFKKFSYEKKKKSPIDKMKVSVDYSQSKDELSLEEKEKLFGIVGTLDDDKMRQLLFEVLSPLKYNFMVTTKEIDYFVDKISLLIGKGINMSLHNVDF